MRDGAERRPGAVPDRVDDRTGDLGGADVVDVARGVDTDADGRPDTLLTSDGTDLLVLTDLDGDGLADRVLRIHPDGSVHTAHPDHLAPAAASGDGDPGHAPVTGHAPVAHEPWRILLERLFGL